MITLPEESSLPLYRQLYQQLKQEIQTQNLAVGQRLPSKRKLAERLGVSVNTVDAAYTQLEAEGFLLASPRRGFFVRETGLPPQAPAPHVPKPQKIPPQPQYRVDFSPAGMAREQFPFGVWRRLMKLCFNEYDPQLLLRTEPQGDPGLRQAVAEYLYRARGVSCTPEQVIIGAGTDNLLFMLSYIFPETTLLAVENPLYNQAHRLFSRMGHPIKTVPVTPSGIDISRLPTEAEAVVYTTPSHQYPLGYAMPIGQRTALLRWCEGRPGRYIIEDDYDSEFRYFSRPIPSLQSIDHLGRVIYLGTFSRSIAPALRISYMVLPEGLLSLYREQYRGYASTVSGFEQAVLREFMNSGRFETHVSRMRSYYRARRQTLADALAPLQPPMEILGAPAGHHLTLRFRDGPGEAQLVSAAARAGVRVYPVSPHFIGQTLPPEYQSTVLLGFGGLTDQQICLGAELLLQAWNVKGDLL